MIARVFYGLLTLLSACRGPVNGAAVPAPHGLRELVERQDPVTNCIGPPPPYNPWKDIPAAPVGGIDPPLVTKDDTLYIPKCDNTDDCSIPEHDEQADTLVAKNAKRDDLDFTSGPLTTGHRLGRRSCFDRNLEQKGGNGVLSYRDQFISQVSVWYLRVQAAGIQYVIRKFQGQLNFVPNIPGVTNDQSFQVDHCFELWIIKQFAYDAVDAGWFPGYNHDFFAATHSPDPPPQLVAFLNSNFNLRGVDGRVNKLKNVVLESGLAKDAWGSWTRAEVEGTLDYMRDVQGQYTNTLVTLARYLTANGATEAGTRLIPYGGTIFQNALTSLQEALDPSSNAQFKTEDAIETQTVGS